VALGQNIEMIAFDIMLLVVPLFGAANGYPEGLLPALLIGAQHAERIAELLEAFGNRLIDDEFHRNAQGVYARAGPQPTLGVVGPHEVLVARTHRHQTHAPLLGFEIARLGRLLEIRPRAGNDE